MSSATALPNHSDKRAAPAPALPQGYAFTHSVADFAKPRGRDLLARVRDYAVWREARIHADVWPYAKSLTAAPAPVVEILDDTGRSFSGLNFASQDYLSLSTHPDVCDAAKEAIDAFGPHSAGSPVLLGASTLAGALERELADALDAPHITLFPTGWAAGFGVITGLVRPYDHVVLDQFAHACLQSGAYAATRNVHRTPHLDLDAVEHTLRAIRSTDTQGGILVVTESLFSMDADTPDLAALQALCDAFEATLLVDVAHDFGALGPTGGGLLEAQGMLGRVDLVIGSFSKTFASNGGFVAARTAEVKQYLMYYAGPHIFSNALSPIQIASVRTALRIVRSDEGARLRRDLAAAVEALRDGLADRGVRCFGDPCPLVPVAIGAERTARLAASRAAERGLLTNLVEFPAVPVGRSRFRMQVMARHTPEQAAHAATLIADILTEMESDASEAAA